MFGNMNTGQIVAGVNKIYADYRNLRVSLYEAVKIAEASIGGRSDADVDRLLEGARKRAAER